MKYIYRKGFDIGHWILGMISIFVHLFAEILKLLTLRLFWFEFELNWTMFCLKNSDKITAWFKKMFSK